MQTHNLFDYGARPNGRDDTTLAVRAALSGLRGTGGGRLVFPRGCYHFWPDRATERYLFVSNNDEGLKRIAFPLFGLQGVEIDGDGSEFVFHGSVTPFAVWDSQDIRFTNFTMDWEQTFHAEAEVLAVGDTRDDGTTSVELRLPAAYPFVVQNERLLFLGEGGEACEFGNVLEFDPARRETACGVHDNYALRSTHQALELAPDRVRLTGQYRTVPTPGNVLTIMHAGRICPGIAIGDSRNVEIADVTIHHAGAMGIIAQRTEGIRLERMRVTPAAHKGRLISATADATHFVNCRGLIELADCVFEGQLDDATNVHGIYARISRLVGPDQIEVELVHGQQVGIAITQPGDSLEFVRRRDLLTYHEAPVTGVERLNKSFSLLTVAGGLPDGVAIGDVVASLGWVAAVHIHGCTMRGNRARGFLLSTPGKVLVEDNHFHNPGSAIVIAGDANYWFESGAVRDVTIRGNRFDNCNFGVWGRAAIDITPEIEPAHRDGECYHRNITVDGNTFDVFDPRLLRAYGVDRLTVTNNIVRPSREYPAPESPGEPFDITDCRNVTVADNRLPAGSAPALTPF